MSYVGSFDGGIIVSGTTPPIKSFDHPRRRASDSAHESINDGPVTASVMSGNVESIMAMFGRIGFGYLVLDDRMRVTKWNDAAKLALEVRSEDAKAITEAFRELTSRVFCKFTTGTVCWVAIPFKGGTPIVVHDDAIVGTSGVCIVMLMSRATSPHPNPARLQQMFGLTSAEAQLATSLAAGQTPLEIARNSKLSRTTIRSHLAALFSKTDTNRQSELVALLNQVSALP